MGPFSFANSAFLWGGTLVAAPILIHLLSKRKFVVVEWAAMKFLMDAQKQNRRRVQLEHLILLILRCLAILLLAALFSRPLFDPSGFGSKALGNHEHIILLDDSPSMEATYTNKTALAEAKESVIDFLNSLSLDHAGDSVTVLLTSRPDRPLVAATQITPETLDDIVSLIDVIEPSAFPARFDGALLAMEKLANDGKATANRTCYIVSDFRETDWVVKDKERGAVAILKRMLGGDVGVSVIEFGKLRDQNAAVVAITPPESTLVAGVPTRFEITVVNHGKTDMDGVELTFSATGSLPMRRTISELAPGARVDVPFTFTFTDPGAVTVQASIGNDPLLVDNVRYLCTRVVEGIRVLVVDGEISARASQSEGFFLDRALAPRGTIPSGYVVDSISPSQLDTVKLDNYQLVAMCNVEGLNDEVAKRFDDWVRSGGGLLWFLGDQVEAEAYNAIAASQPGIMPLQLTATVGDMSEKRWVGFGDVSATHPVLRLFEGGAFLRQAKFFQWWKVAVPKSNDAVKVLARFNDVDETPALVEQSLGDGSVMVCATAADDEWGTWVSDPSYLVTMQEMARHLAKRIVSTADLPAGDPLKHRIDPSVHASSAAIYKPGQRQFDTVQAAPVPDSHMMELIYDDTDAFGQYRIVMDALEGGKDEAHVAINVGAMEGNMKQVRKWPTLLGDAAQDLVINEALVASKDIGGRIQLWRPLLIALILVLCIEQALARYFGAKRQAPKAASA